MPGLVKIGRTDDSVESRLTALSSATGIPLAFECYFAAEVEDAPKVERILHQLFAEHRVNLKREFFRIDPEKAVLALSIGKFKQITTGDAEVEKEEKEALEKVKARRPKLRLDAIGVPPGSILNFSRDETVVATVVEDGKVNLKGKILSLSASALEVLHEMGYTTPSASGSEYWMYDGELLDERRRRIEAELFEEPLSPV
jgi:hypothetical protein